MDGALYAGLMSGTSMDGVAAVLARFNGTRFLGIVSAVHHDYPADLRTRLIDLVRNQPALSARDWCALDAAVADVFAAAAQRLLAQESRQPGDLRAIGSHGQTVFHDATAEPRLTLQLGDPSRIAARTGATVVGDFRRRDLALGGQGAPLLPAFHHALFASATEPRAVLNLGGIANVTLLPGLAADAITGFDTGPGNGLMDEWCLRHTGAPFDADGALAAHGRTDPALVAALLADPYFSRPPPKSTGRGDFHLDWVRGRYPALDDLGVADVQASLAEVTARSIAEALLRQGARPRRLLACGGGVRNGYLMGRIAARLPDVVVETTDAHGLAAEHVEAAAFAWFAARTLHGQTSSLPSVTGASAPAILGGIYPA